MVSGKRAAWLARLEAACSCAMPRPCAQVGWEPGPTLAMLAWEAQWLLYTGGLERALARPAATLPVFTDQARPQRPPGLGHAGADCQ
jgi:hypothetical protein